MTTTSAIRNPKSKIDRRRRRELPDDEIINIHVNYYQTGSHIRDLARLFEIDYRHLSQRFKDLNLPIARNVEFRCYRPPGHLYPLDKPWPPENPDDCRQDSGPIRNPQKRSGLQKRSG